MPLPLFNFNDFRKNPLPCFLLIVCVAAGYLYNNLITMADRRMQDCLEEKELLQHQVEQLREEISRKDSLIYVLKLESFAGVRKTTKKTNEQH